MKGPELLRKHVGRLAARMGGFVAGSRAVFRGHDLHVDLRNVDWVELYYFGITGRRFSPAQVKLLHALWVNTSYPDPRIWNNRVAALSGTARSTGTLGLAAALAVSEASIYGRGVDVRAIDFLIRTRERLQSGGTLDECVREELRQHRGIAGYGRPLKNADERIEPTMVLAHELGFDDGPHVRLAFAVEQFLLAGRWRWRMNYAALAAALLADMGVSTREYHLCAFPTFLAGMAPCFIEARERIEGTFYPLACDHITYLGATKRSWKIRNTLLSSAD